MESVLYGPPRLAKAPARHWITSDFRDVDDRVRGGSSRSTLRLIGQDIRTSVTPDVKRKEKAKEPSEDIENIGEVVFEGFLDTTTLGGAGFSSQVCSTGFPWSVSQEQFRGLALRYRQPSPSVQPEEKQPGGGNTPVTSYVIQLKMAVPESRPDGRRESVVAYEWEFDTNTAAAKETPVGQLVRVAADWSAFRPTYRGRPKDGAEPLDPAKVKEWSIMARSNFGSQSGSFLLQIAALSAIHSTTNLLATGKETNKNLMHPVDRTSGEYYGFALFIFATVMWALWCLWALLPDSALKWLGVEWYPNREWAYLIPAWSLMTVLLTYIGFMALNIYNTPSHEDLRTVTDSHANVLPQPGALAGMRISETGQEQGPLAAGIYDLPLGMVSRALYLDQE
ncbi:CIA30-domain-containing protein [Tilletiaria anomala UBC 951]|uniref:CIA30-domain-containing protein n=1 Tax=Tilletiaria anomala (strain ATCC 24038 / CBS 436.72 / UBC 951) TaxID=1037660 RepID=A0A066WGU2_TILAU|nr:CIA30-domain-containing protein [Tilletiaria anomala UBC 951]KDN53217.1 CIA30-domain-containing protein [Tilletiaria anomala UBC 951]